MGLYIHVPFCRRKCLYCDFCSFPAQKSDVIADYVRALCEELRENAKACALYVVDTVYFGGGTPTLLTTAQFADIFSALRDNYNIADDAEITVECNPLTNRERRSEYLSFLRTIGVNRLSIGVQSADDGELRLIGRGHTFAEAKQTYLAARKAGFENISVDLIFALPSQTKQSLSRTVDELIALCPEHISIYSLQLEEGTPLYKLRDRYDLPSDDDAADMYELIVKRMADSGYNHYEISNFAKPGFESRHNSKYWSLDEYLGAGLAAHTDFGGVRWENTKNLADYLSGVRVLSQREISSSEREEEYIMLGLRTSKGISASEFSALFGKDLFARIGEKLKPFAERGLVICDGDRIRLSEAGFEVSNTILAELLEFDY